MQSTRDARLKGKIVLARKEVYVPRVTGGTASFLALRGFPSLHGRDRNTPAGDTAATIDRSKKKRASAGQAGEQKINPDRGLNPGPTDISC
jgi:hypothetical protein